MVGTHAGAGAAAGDGGRRPGDGLVVGERPEMVNLEQLTGGADVKGWMTLEQVAGGSGMDTATLYAELGLSADIPPETALKESGRGSGRVRGQCGAHRGR